MTDPAREGETLCTFSGKHGDILWSLATVREISKAAGKPVDFACMPDFRGVIPLAARQPYVRHAFAIEGWDCAHTGCGAQPGTPPDKSCDGYANVRHLTYCPGPNCPLVIYIAKQQGLILPEGPLPFLEADAVPYAEGELPRVGFAFTPENGGLKQRLLNSLAAKLHGQANLVNIAALPWLDAANMMASAAVFVGCRSGNMVIAHGLAKPIIGYEPNHGRLQSMFSCPFGREEHPVPHGEAPERHADAAADQIRAWIREWEAQRAAAS